MSGVPLTKTELKRQRDILKRLQRYLPMLELRKKLLMQEIAAVRERIAALEAEIAAGDAAVAPWAAVFADDIDVRPWIRVAAVRTATGNIAGIDVPIFERVDFHPAEIDPATTPLWVDDGVAVLREQIARRAAMTVEQETETILREDLETTIQRIKLFEEVKIPEARAAIRRIRIALGDQQTAEVARGKIAKAKLQRKRRSDTEVPS